MLANELDWSESKKSIIIELRDDVYWNDSVKCSVDDIIFSFDIYSDPKVQSRFLGYFENFYTDKDGYIDSSKTFEKLDSNRLKIKFKDNSQPQLIDIDYPIIPKHFWSKFKREEIPTSHIPSYVSNGAFVLERWEKEEAIILAKNPNCFLVNEATVNR
nr:ABC transporter substrate-binding protein [Melioribacteraceae bacterium]